ncbi:MAG: Cpe/LpqF family protein [Acidimicrobiales bacterium]
MKHRFGGALVVVALISGAACRSDETVRAARPGPTTSAPSGTATYVSLSIPDSPVGAQLGWFLEAAAAPPIPVPVIQQHFSAAFLSQIPPDQLNTLLVEGGGPSAARLVGVLKMTRESLDAEVDLGEGGGHLVVSMTLDADGLISGLAFRPATLGPRAALGLPAVSLPRPTGSHPVGTETVVTSDADRGGRRIPVQLWYPAVAGGDRTATPSRYALEATSAGLAAQFGVPVEDIMAIRTNAGAGAPVARAAGRFPVVVFSPGLGVTRPLYSGIGAELASHGYVVAVTDHPGDGLSVEFPDGATVEATAPGDDAMLAAMLATRVADARTVLGLLERLDAEPGTRLHQALDLSGVAVAGHSFGGATAAEVMRVDRRFRAGVDLDGTLYGEVVGTGLDRPFLLVSSDRPAGEGDESWPAFRQRTPRAVSILLAGSAHLDFSDVATLSALRPAGERGRLGLGTIEPARSFAVQSAYLLAFLDRELRGGRQPLLDGPSAKYPEVTFE